MSDNINDLRRLADDGDSSFDDEPANYGTELTGEKRLFLGMTPIERMFISMFLFMNVAVLGIAILLATGRIGG
jgi:hypothetical protein